MRQPIRSRRPGEQGIALIMAILALMLLTTLGITLSLTTSTELQIATNYKWSQQALYNAEAGIEAGKRILQEVDWNQILPAPRTTSWAYANPPAPPTAIDGSATRNFENEACDNRGGVGYGTVLSEAPSGGVRYQNVSSFRLQGIHGAFTLWVRRPVIPVAVQNSVANYVDYSADSDRLILTSEGVAPFTGTLAGTAFGAANQARRVMETMLSRAQLQCGVRGGQLGGGSEGANMGACAELGSDSLKKGLAGTAGAGTGAEKSVGGT